MATKIGDLGRAMCPLYPSGRVSINRAPIPALAENGPIEEGTEIVVVGGDRFSLIVRAYDSSQPVNSIKDFGREILIGKEDAVFQAVLFGATRRRQAAEHQQIIRKLMTISAVSGLVIGLGLVVIEVSRNGYTHTLLWIPPMSAIGWFCLICLVCSFGLATESLLAFVSVPFAFAGLILGMWLGGPFSAVALSFVIGITVTMVSLLVEAMRHPVT
jgi:hypothetical protein